MNYQHPILHQLQPLITKGILPENILLSGSEGMGVFQIAQEIAARILGITVAQLVTHPDYKVAYHEDNAQYVPHTLEEMHEIISFVHASRLSPNRVIIIPDADLFTSPVANSLLKTLEEPHEHTFFILLARNATSVLPTIMSRVTVWHVNPVSDGIVQEVCASFSKKDFFDDVVTLAMGRPFLALELCENNKLRKVYLDDRSLFISLLSAPDYERIGAAEKIAAKGDHEEKKRLLREKLERFQLFALQEMERDVVRAPLFAQWIDECGKHIVALSHHGNARAHVDVLLLALPHL